MEKLGSQLPTGRLTSEQLPQDGRLRRSHKSAELFKGRPHLGLLSLMGPLPAAFTSMTKGLVVHKNLFRVLRQSLLS